MAFDFYPEMSEKQFNSLAFSDARINIWHGSVRSSKTIMSIIRWLEYIKIAPKGKLIMVGKTERTLKRNILDVIEEMVGSDNYKLVLGSGQVEIYGRKIDIVGANDERSEGKIRGITCAGAYGDEVTLWPESFFKMLLSRLSVRGAKLFVTTNPDSPYHWLKEGYLDRADELNMTVWHFTLEDNPALDPAYVESLKTEYTGLWYKRFIEGLWVLAEGAIYDMFDEDKHVYTEHPTRWEPYEQKDVVAYERYYITCDYGTANPCVFLLIGETGDGHAYVIAEYYFNGREAGFQKTDKKYSEDLGEFVEKCGLEMSKIEGMFVDPSAKSFITQLREDWPELRIIEANNDVVDGIRTVSTELAQGRLHIHTDCKNVKREFTAYIWDPKAQKVGEDKPIKEHDHTLDAIRYYIYTRLTMPRFVLY